MRETIGSTWVFQLVLLFILLFAAYLTVSINFSKSFKAKNDVLSIIEKYEGLTPGNGGGMSVVNNYLVSSNYKAKGTCEVGYYGAVNINGNNTISDYEFVDSASSEKYYYCIRKVSGYYSGKMKRSYYRIVLFFSLDLPVLGDIFTFSVNGQTSEIDNTYDGSLFTTVY